jgi:signal transduction histidine kinase
VDASGDIIFCNNAGHDIVTHQGAAPAALLPEDLESIFQAADEQGETEFHREVEVNNLLFSEMLYFAKQYGTLRIFPVDITERRKAEVSLGESERQLRILATRLMEVQEAERGRITKELHDELGQSLLLLKLKLSGILDHLPTGQNSLHQQIVQLLAAVDSLIDNIGRLIMDLSPKIVEELGLTSAIKVLLEEFAQEYHVGFDLDHVQDIDNLFPAPVQLGIYRIIQESLTNIGKHAKATRIFCTIKKRKEQVWFSIKDDGQGCERKDRQGRGDNNGGNGLSIMKERARLAGGQLEIQSQVGAGTEITFSIPYQVKGK